MPDKLWYKFKRLFDGVEGERSTDIDGPRAIQHDLDELGKFFDPESFHDDGSPGGINIGNLGPTFTQIIEGQDSFAKTATSDPIEGLDDPDTGLPATTVWTQINGLVHMIRDGLHDAFRTLAIHEKKTVAEGVHGFHVDESTGFASYIDSRETWHNIRTPGNVDIYELTDLVTEMVVSRTHPVNGLWATTDAIRPEHWFGGLWEVFMEIVGGNVSEPLAAYIYECLFRNSSPFIGDMCLGDLSIRQGSQTSPEPLAAYIYECVFGLPVNSSLFSEGGLAVYLYECLFGESPQNGMSPLPAVITTIWKRVA